MTHQHNSDNRYHRCGYPRKCQYNFPHAIKPESTFNDRGMSECIHHCINLPMYCLSGYFEPRRRKADDSNIVLHVPYLILKYDCHINVEYSGSVSLFQYLYKYFYKGPDEANWAVRMNRASTAGPRKPIDQIKDYERGRWIGSLEAATRIAGYHISKKHPGVTRLPVLLPNTAYTQMRRNNGSQSTATLDLSPPPHCSRAT
jgi:hypothetical protein